jgi:hypothetical protein
MEAAKPDQGLAILAPDFIAARAWGVPMGPRGQFKE